MVEDGQKRMNPTFPFVHLPVVFTVEPKHLGEEVLERCGKLFRMAVENPV